jgi:O-methyltransferase
VNDTVKDVKAVKIASRYSKCTYERLWVVADTLKRIDAEGIEGDVVECGVWKGGIVILTRLLSPQRTVWLYDTFNGMAGLSEFDTTKAGYIMPEGKAAVSVTEVMANLAKTGTMHEAQLNIVEGKVEETLLIERNIPDKIALLHLDTDWYHSTKIELEKLWPRLVPRGALIVDDYGHWKGSRKAFDEYFPPLKRSHIAIDRTAIMMVR